MTYAYDAFFSYKRDRESDAWHRRVKDKIAYWLRLELARTDVRIFFDDEEIRTGSRFSAKIADSLRRSKCLVCVWSPLYFRSSWCLSEWQSFLQREVNYGAQLIIPASFHDGETFPDTAKAIQTLDFSEFASTMPRFWDTESAVRFEESRLRPFARDLAALIRAAPPYDEAFPVLIASEHDTQPELPIGRIADV
ncbi:toll/interleukin-1 receptor domain-containing protein [Ideonella sp. A 288]|uniref:toll/interleukin-1 receptor domain-containing protein n=1 Tax=Ideonella sp. A 288 TaxID=1962181 RepID=UPI0013035B7B|nr:toll/interleukin-1 receptor domain-containing protein [Ideonella sp. A 288]